MKLEDIKTLLVVLMKFRMDRGVKIDTQQSEYHYTNAFTQVFAYISLSSGKCSIIIKSC